MSKDLMICDKSGDFCVSSSSSSTRVPFFRVSTFAPLHASIPDFNSGFRSSSVVGSPVVFSLLSRANARHFRLKKGIMLSFLEPKTKRELPRNVSSVVKF